MTRTLDGRTARKLSNHAIRNKYRSGSTVLVICQSSGAKTYQGQNIWDLTADGLWIPDHYVSIGHVGYAPGLNRCVLPKRFVVRATLDGRTVKRMSNHAQPDRYPKGSTVRIVCQAFGGRTYQGSYLWNRTSAGDWVPDYYVKTGTSGPVRDLPRCDVDKPAGAKARRLRLQDLQFSPDGAVFVGTFEGFRARPYNDAGGHCTVGFGHLIHRDHCTQNDDARWSTLSRDAALGLLWQDLDRFAAGVRTALPKTSLRQSEFDALVSFAYNVGNGGFRSSSVSRHLNASPPKYAAVPRDLLAWVYSGKRPLCGLYRRRHNEGNLFRTGSYALTFPTCPYPRALSVSGQPLAERLAPTTEGHAHLRRYSSALKPNIP